MSRYIPTIEVTVGGTNVTNDVTRIKTIDGPTSITPYFDVTLNDQSKTDIDAEKYSFGWTNSIVIEIDGTDIMRGRVERVKFDYTKKDGYLLHLIGRGNGAALQDIISSIHSKDQQASTTVQDIMDEYTNLHHGSDPNLSVGINRAGTTNTIEWLWRRLSLWDMLKDVATTLGSPTADNEFQDFWVSPEVNNPLYFYEIGYYPTSNLQTVYTGSYNDTDADVISVEAEKDGMEVKTDVWVVGGRESGRIPLTMQTGYTGFPNDSWTENTAIWNKIDAPNSTLDIAYMGGSPPAAPSTPAYGNYCIELQTNIDATDPHGIYVSFPNSKWSAQEPGGHLNIFNECQLSNGYTGRSESMGEITGVGFYFASSLAGQVGIKVYNDIGGEGPILQSVYQTYERDWLGPTYWKLFNFPLGPTIDWQGHETGESDQELFDWADIERLELIFAIAGPSHIWFDGFRFIKPLVVRDRNTSYYSYRTEFVDAHQIDDYTTAAIYAEAIRQKLQYPTYGYRINMVGRSDIKPGYKFNLNNINGLIAREVQHEVTKDGGWTTMIRGYKPITGSKHYPNVKAGVDSLMKELKEKARARGGDMLTS